MSESPVKNFVDSPLNKTLDESLSALMDGEINELELRRLLKTSDEDYAVLKRQWLRHQVASAALRKETPVVPFTDLSAGISALVEQEEAHSMMAKPLKQSSIWSGVGRFAIAASVAGAVVVGVQFAPSDQTSQFVDSVPPASTTTQQQSKVPSSFGHGLPVDTTVRTVSNNSDLGNETSKNIIVNEDTQQQLQQAEDDLNRLMLEHAQNASQNTQQGILPYARVPESSETAPK